MDLQIKNHFSSLTEAEKEKHGFISLLTDKDVLTRLIESKLVFLAKNKFSSCIGYIFAIPRDFANELVFLKPLVLATDNQLISESKNYFILGQICVAQDFQGNGVALKLYKRLERELAGRKCKTLITEVAVSNPRSLVFHRDKVGFSELVTNSTNGQEFKILMKTIS
jgi:predicted GNAT superfamily acetyltransferase